jgi:hypothetical protein
VKKSRRTLIVLTSLVGVLTFTSALLLALSPAPLSPDTSASLFAVDAPTGLDVVFETKVPPARDRWAYVFVHHSNTPAGSALTLAQRNSSGLGDHFVIGNGDGCADGEIQIGQRWNNQLSATPPAGATNIDPKCISICLVGDFDHTVPTPTQLKRLAQLIETIQSRLQIPAERVMLVTQPGVGGAGIGKYFPTAAFREQLLAVNP